METPRLPQGARFNFSRMEVLLLDASQQGQEIFGLILMGFGVKKIHRFETAEDAETFLQRDPVDLVITEGQLQEGKRDGYDFVRWLRRSGLDPNAFLPVIMASGHTSAKNVAKARDCGANMIVSKPISAQILMHRILWVGTEKRCFVDAGNYLGPDRRFKNVGPPRGTDGRRSTDLKEPIGAAVDPNMDQDEVDSLIKPQKVRAL